MQSSNVSVMRLATLPTELVENIANYLDLAAFRSLRLVCSSLNRQSLHHFKDGFFRRRTITWDVGGFRKALDVTLHPHFGNALQDLIIDATPRYAILLWKLKMQMAVFESLATQSEYNLMNEKAEGVAKFWNETRNDQKTLITIFEKMQTLQSITFAYDGMDRRYGKFGRRYCETSQSEMSRPFVSTMAAIAASGIVVYEISVHDEKRHGAVSIGRLESLSPALSKFNVAFEHLRALNLNLRDWRYPEEGFEPPVGRAPLVVRFLSKCKNIRKLELSCFSSLQTDIFAEMAKSCRYPLMESCKLELFRIKATDDLFEFLEPANSLRSLELSHVVLQDETVLWGELMLRIASSLALDRLQLKNLFTRTGARIGFEGTLDGPLHGIITLTDPGLQSALQYCANHLVSGNWGPAWHLAAVAYPFVGLRT